MRTIKPNPAELIFVAVAGTTNYSPANGYATEIIELAGHGQLFPRNECSTESGTTATAAPRLHTFTSAVSGVSLMLDLCQMHQSVEDMTPFAGAVSSAIFGGCLTRPLADGTMQTVTAECHVSLQDTEREIPNCDHGPAPCWSAQPTAQCASTTSGLGITLDWGSETTRSDGSLIAVCPSS